MCNSAVNKAVQWWHDQHVPRQPCKSHNTQKTPLQFFFLRKAEQGTKGRCNGGSWWAGGCVHFAVVHKVRFHVAPRPVPAVRPIPRNRLRIDHIVIVILTTYYNTILWKYHHAFCKRPGAYAARGKQPRTTSNNETCALYEDALTALPCDTAGSHACVGTHTMIDERQGEQMKK